MSLVCTGADLRFCSSVTDPQEEWRNTEGTIDEDYLSPKKRRRLFFTYRNRWPMPVNKCWVASISSPHRRFSRVWRKFSLPCWTYLITSTVRLPPSVTLVSSLTLVGNQSTPPSYSHLIDLRLYTTKHIHVLKYQLLAFVNNILSAEFFIKMVTIDFFFIPTLEKDFS